MSEKTSYFPIELQTGFSFEITKTTNGGFPLFGPFAVYLNNMFDSYDVTHVYRNVSGGVATMAETSLSNSLYTTNDRGG